MIESIRSKKIEEALYFKNLPMGEEKILKWMDLWGKEYSDLIHQMIPWKNQKDIFSIAFEEISPIKILELANFLNIQCNNPEEILNKSLNTETITSTNKRSDYTEYWTENIEKEYKKLGFADKKLFI